ncbi:MAG TPA: FtsQ-type POTRA domain-containing protein [Acetobacteraceae bacterium]
MPRVAPPDARPTPSAAPGRTPAKPPRPLEERARASTARPRSDRPTRWQLMLRRRRRLLRPAALGLVALLTAGGVAVLARGAHPGPAVAGLRERVAAAANLRVDHVRIEGRILTPEALLRTALGVAVGDRLLGFPLEAARARIEALTWVQHATV